MNKLKNFTFFMLLPVWTFYGRAEAAFKTFTASKGGKLEISVGNGDLRIRTWAKNEVLVEYEDSEEDDDWGRLQATQTGDLIQLRSRGWEHGGNVDISIPSQFNLRVRSGYGNISIDGPLSGEIRVVTSGGDLLLGDVGGKVEAGTSGGNIQAGRIEGDAFLETGGGDIRVEEASGALELLTSGGNVTVGNVKRTLKVESSGGDIVIGDVGSEASVTTSGGNVLVGIVSGRAVLETAGGDIRLAGGSGTVRAITSGGDLMLEELSGSVEAETGGGDIMAELYPSGKGKSRLASGGGDIELYLPQNAKATVEARIRIQGSWRMFGDEFDIYSDFKAATHAKNRNEREISATYLLNGGGEDILLETVNGEIDLRALKGKAIKQELKNLQESLKDLKKDLKDVDKKFKNDFDSEW